MKKLLMATLLFTTSLFANLAINHNDQGDAYHSGTGKVLHDGDFIEFNVDFNANCYTNRDQSWDLVTENVATFIDWVDQEQYLTGENIEWSIAPLSLWRNDQGFNYPCEGTYNASQSIKVTLNKGVGANSLDVDLIQDFYARLQLAVWPLNNTESGEVPSRVSTDINGIEKGVYEETADNLRIAAKNKAQIKATLDFKAFLGPDYTGTWYLQSVDFRESGDNPYLKMAVGEAMAPMPPMGGDLGGSLPTPATLKLKPLTVSVTGNFHFVFDLIYNG